MAPGSFRRMVLAGAMVALGSGRAGAQTSFFTTESAQFAYTDNLYNAPSQPAPGLPGRIATAYVTLVPGLALYHDSLRARYLLGYQHGFSFSLGHGIPLVHSDTGSLRGIFLLTPVDELTIELNATRQPIALLYSQGSGAGGPQVATRSSYFIGGVRQMLRHEYTANWIGIQSSYFGVAKPLGAVRPDPWRFDVGATVGAEYRLERDAWGFDLNAGYYHTFATSWQERRPLGELTAGPVEGWRHHREPSSRELTVGPLARWRHDLSAEWSSSLRAGFQVAYWLTGHEPTSLYPTWGAALNWQHDPASATISYGGSVVPDLVTNRVYFADTLDIMGRLVLIPEYDVAIFSGAGVGMYRTVGGGAAASSRAVYTWSGTAGLSCVPATWLQTTLSYAHLQQFGPGTGSQGLPAFYRNLVLLSLQGHIPATPIGEIPSSGPVRVDEADRAPDAPGLAPAAQQQPEPEGTGTRPTQPTATPQTKEVVGPVDSHVPASPAAPESDHDGDQPVPPASGSAPPAP